MRAQWYGDNRDLIKWATLIHLCEKHRLKRIIQVPFSSPKENGCPHKLSVDEKDDSVDFPPAVWKHFRDLNHIEKLGKRTALTIKLFEQEFSPKTRVDYVQKMCVVLKAHNEAKIVFLDPDTGVEPQKAGGEHVKIEEIKSIWNCLSRGDWLVLYQHAFRNRKWRKLQRVKFEDACGVRGVEMYHSKIAHDVVLFAACKPSEAR